MNRRPSFRVTHLLVKQGKLLAYVELITSCLIIVAEEIYPEKINLFKTFSLFVRTVVKELRIWRGTSIVN